MVKEAGSDTKGKGGGSGPAAARKEQPLEYDLGALLYYDQKKSSDGKVPAFEDVDQAEQKKFVQHAAKVLLMLDQLNKMVVPRVDPSEMLQIKLASMENIKQITQAFVKTLDKPKGVARFFPVDELARRIVEGRMK